MNEINFNEEPNLTWTISTFSTLKAVQCSEKMVFTHNNSNIQWFLRLHPIVDEFISIYLHFEVKHQMHIYFKYIFEDKDGKHIRSLISDRNFTKSAHICGFCYFAQRKEILPLKDDTLIVKCWICTLPSKDNDCIEYICNDLNKLMLDGFTEMLTSGSFCDVTLQTSNGTTFHAHKCILASCSPVFKAMFMHNMKESQENKVIIEDMHSDVLGALIEFIYSHKFKKELSIFDELLIASDKYQIDILKTICEKELCHQLSTENAIDYLILADNYHAQKLKIKALNCVKVNLQTFIKNKFLKKKLETKPHLLYEIIEHLSEYI